MVYRGKSERLRSTVSMVHPCAAPFYQLTTPQGAGESGKSTVFKQMRILHGKGFSQSQRKEKVGVVHANILNAMQALVEAAEDIEAEIGAKDEANEIMELLSDETRVNDELAATVEKLWADPGIQTAYEQRSRFQIPDSAEYFVGRVRAVAESEYIPTEQDIIKMRVKTSGIVVEEFEIADEEGDTVKFEMYDVGGQRNERRKWIHCFDEVTAVIFVAAISEYDQLMYEDGTQNRLMDALELFEEIVNSRWFERKSFILFLNKRDIFQDKIEHKDIRQEVEPGVFLFDDYRGGCDYAAGVHYLVGQFLKRNHNRKRDVYYHVTEATDKANVRTVFDACREIVLRDNLQYAGMAD